MLALTVALTYTTGILKRGQLESNCAFLQIRKSLIPHHRSETSACGPGPCPTPNCGLRSRHPPVFVHDNREEFPIGPNFYVGAGAPHAARALLARSEAGADHPIRRHGALPHA